ncbi:MAG: RNA methyltransferase [Firmicutes bacterium]|nr:RNA methyltransferase [Bacillota bacterium]
MVITSKDNESVKHVRKLKDKKSRVEYKEYIVEGVKLIHEAIIMKANIKTIFVCDDCAESGAIGQKVLYEIAKYNCIYVSEIVFDTMTDVQTHQGILAVIGIPDSPKEINYNQDVILILDDIQDPGNMGTILRTADSCGLKQIVASSGSSDIYNPKVVRATMGAIFRINVIESDDILVTMKILKKHKFKVLATSLDTDKNIYDVEYKKVGIVIGNESSGVSRGVLQVADGKIKIPMLGRTESLNASVATAVILYEYVRQKLKKT